LNPDVPGHECFSEVHLRNGEKALRAKDVHFARLMDRAEEAVRGALSSPLDGVCTIFVDSSASSSSTSAERNWQVGDAADARLKRCATTLCRLAKDKCARLST
jgi:triphosphoribosyl-dephospho-CoA synthetase